MKNKKKQFEALKSRLKNLYFKKALSIQKKLNVFKLLIEKQENLVNLPTVEKIKNKQVTQIVADTKIPKLKNVELKSVAPKIYNHFIKNIVQKIHSSVKNYKIEPIAKNYSTNYKIESNSSSTPNIKVSPRILNVSTVKNKNYTSQNINKVTNNFDKLSFSNIKFVEKPDQIKNIKPDEILNTTNYDIKTLYIPSKEELINIRNNVVNRKEIKLSSVTNRPQTKNVVQTNNNNSSITNKKVNKSVYVLPAYYDGTGEPVKNDTIARIHKNEVVLSANQVKSLKGNQSGVVKNKTNDNLKPPSQNTISDTSIDTADNKTIIPNSNNLTQKSEHKESLVKDVIPNENINLFRLNNAADTPQLDKNITSIEKNLSQPLFFTQDYKNKSLPVWRATFG